MIYIDRPRERKGRITAHMVADTLQELHDFAERFGLHRRYFQAAKKHPHYDLWGFPLALIEKLAKERRGVMLVTNKELVLKSHLLIKNQSHGKSNSEESLSEKSSSQKGSS